MPKKSSAASNETALVIDANALIHRAWHALPPLTAPDGRVVNAVYGFSMALMKIVAATRPDFLIVCWDTPEPTYRHEANAEYKAHRAEQPDEFYAQFPLVKDVVAAYGGINIELPGYEADDLLATTAARLSADGVRVSLLTSDKDALQIIAPLVRVVAFQKGVSETREIDEAELFRTTGLRPEQIPDYKALRGDPSDNLSGVAGIGEKTATTLLVEYGDLDGVFNAAHDAKSALSVSVRKKLLEGEAIGRTTLPLVRLVNDAPIPKPQLSWRRRPVDEVELEKLFKQFGFKTLLSRLKLSASSSEEASDSGINGIEIVSNANGFAKMTAPGAQKRQASSASANVPLATLEELKALCVEARSAKKMILHVASVDQPSLFGDAPEIFVGVENTVLAVGRAMLSDKKTSSEFAEICADATIRKIGYGLKNIWHRLADRGYVLDGLWFDVELAAYLLMAGEGRPDLASLAMTHLGRSIDDASPESGVAVVVAVRDLLPKLEVALKDQKLDTIFFNCEMPLAPVLAQMEREGILIDREYFKKLHDLFSKEKQRIESEMEKAAGVAFNPASPQQLAHVLFEVLKISSRGIKRGKIGISTAASELEKLEGAHPMIELIGEHRELAKLLSTYVDTLPLSTDADGRIHTTFNQTVAATGRLSSVNPNLQNIPIRTELGRKIRRGFIAKPGYCLLSCDYSQIELRIAAALAKDHKMIEAFEQRLDIHTATAAAIWNIPLEDVTKDQRRAAKAINFGILYGQGPQGLAKGAGIPFDEAKKFIAQYFDVYRGIRDYIETVKALTRSQGYVETLFGRRRLIPDIVSPAPQFRAAAERMAVNMPVQGTSADIIKFAMIAIAKELPLICSGARMLLQVHDELLFEVPSDAVADIAKHIAPLMEQVEKIGVPIVVEAKIGVNWDEMTPVKFS